MSTYSKTTIIGNLGQDPQTTTFENGGQITRFSVATSEHWIDKSTNEKRTHTEWHNVVTSGKTAEIAEKYLSKGDKVLIEGKMKTRKWQDKEGKDRFMAELSCELMRFMSTKGKRTEDHSVKPPEEPMKPNINEGENDDLPF